MKNFFNFNVDKKKDSYSASIELKNFIENVVEQDELNALYEKFSLITLIPKDVLMNKCKNILFSNFDLLKLTRSDNSEEISLLSFFSKLIFNFSLDSKSVASSTINSNLGDK